MHNAKWCGGPSEMCVIPNRKNLTIVNIIRAVSTELTCYSAPSNSWTQQLYKLAITTFDSSVWTPRLQVWSLRVTPETVIWEWQRGLLSSLQPSLCKVKCVCCAFCTGKPKPSKKSSEAFLVDASASSRLPASLDYGGKMKHCWLYVCLLGYVRVRQCFHYLWHMKSVTSPASSLYKLIMV